jgi:CheY-like chemotaxis protein
MAIGGYAEMLLLSVTKDSSQHSDVLEIISVVDRGTALVRQLLTFSRRKEPKLDDLDLNATVASLIRLLERTLGKDITLVSTLSESLPLIRADMSQMEQIVINLAVNARDAMPKGGVLHIETKAVRLDANHPALQGARAPGHYVKLSVSDTGTGMTEEVRSRIFEPFFTTKQEGQGTGLGLATVYSIVEDHRGIIQVSSEPGHGTTFHIFLPAPPQGIEDEESHGASAAIRMGSETVLLLEDDPVLREMTSEALEAFGYRVLTADGIKQAVAVLEDNEHDIDLLVADVVLRDTSGPAAYEQLKALTPGLRVLFISGFSRNVVTAYGLPYDALLLEKPYSLTSLTSAVRKALNGDRREEETRTADH